MVYEVGHGKRGPHYQSAIRYTMPSPTAATASRSFRRAVLLFYYRHFRLLFGLEPRIAKGRRPLADVL